MRADYHKVDRLSAKVLDLVSVAREIRATTPAGSDFARNAQSELPLAQDQRAHQP